MAMVSEKRGDEDSDCFRDSRTFGRPRPEREVNFSFTWNEYQTLRSTKIQLGVRGTDGHDQSAVNNNGDALDALIGTKECGSAFRFSGRTMMVDGRCLY
jgi:hypothetical protein